jgi:hypothetical protein
LSLSLSVDTFSPESVPIHNYLHVSDMCTFRWSCHSWQHGENYKALTEIIGFPWSDGSHFTVHKQFNHWISLCLSCVLKSARRTSACCRHYANIFCQV